VYYKYRFSGLGNITNVIVFEEHIIVFQAPAQFQKKNRYLEDMSIFPIIVDLPIENGGSFHSFLLVYQPTYFVYLKFSLDPST
jgi:hypothetical protein